MGGSVVRLRRQIPYTVAADLLLTGRHIYAPEAKEIGLIGEVVPDGKALDERARLPPRSPRTDRWRVQAVLRGAARHRVPSEAEAMKIDSEIGMPVFMSDDAKEGPTAFMEKRTPQFKGQ